MKLDYGTIDYKYSYPEGLDLSPGSEMHDKILSLVLERVRASSDTLKTRFPSWNQIDRTLTAYIPADEEDNKVKREDSRKPTTVVVPVSYATLETLLTYMVAAFFHDPLFRYDAAGPEDVLGAALLELVIAHQTRKSKTSLGMHTMWRGGFSYGIAAGFINYERRFGLRTTIAKEKSFAPTVSGGEVETGELVRSKEETLIFEGSTLTPLDSYMLILDPNVPTTRFQEGEFAGFIDRTNLSSVMLLEKDSDGGLFNTKYLKHCSGTSQFNTRDETGRDYKAGGTIDIPEVSNPVDLIRLFVKIIPKDVGLGSGDYPETWMFTVAGDKIVLGASPVDLDHGMFPIVVVAPDYDGHSCIPISRLETVYELQETMDWMFRSHVVNVRKSLKNNLVVDPQMINVYDLSNPNDAGIIRMRRHAFGHGVRDAIMQLDVRDVTASHINDTSYIRQMIRETTGAQDAISGIRRQTSERVSATEARDTKQSALSRLEKTARIVSQMCHEDIAYQMACNTRQFMEESTYVKIVGEWANRLQSDYGSRVNGGFVKVTPEDLDIDFDVIMHDGAIPNSNDPSNIIQLMQVFSKDPAIMQQLDTVRIFKNVARISGFKNVDEFIKSGGDINPVVTSQENINKSVQAGNLVPIGGGGV